MSSLSPKTPGPTAQQQALQTEQATTNANLNLEENETRKTILNAMQGTRVFRGSALSRQIAGNSAATAAPQAPPGISGQQQNAPLTARTPGASLLDLQEIAGSAAPAASAAAGQGATPAGRGGGNPGRGPLP